MYLRKNSGICYRLYAGSGEPLRLFRPWPEKYFDIFWRSNNAYLNVACNSTITSHPLRSTHAQFIIIPCTSLWFFSFSWPWYAMNPSMLTPARKEIISCHYFSVCAQAYYEQQWTSCSLKGCSRWCDGQQTTQKLSGIFRDSATWTGAMQSVLMFVY